jgi:hypothetical protein
MRMIWPKVDEEGDVDRPDHRHQDHEGSPRAGRSEGVGVVADDKLAEEQEVVHQTDQVAERNGAEPRYDANDKSQQREIRQPDAAAPLRVTRKGEGWRLWDQRRASCRRGVVRH